MRKTPIYKNVNVSLPPEIDCYRADAKFDWADSKRIIPIGYTEGIIAFSDGFREGWRTCQDYYSLKNRIKRPIKAMAYKILEIL